MHLSLHEQKLRPPNRTRAQEITGRAQFSFPLSFEITSFEVAEITGSKGQYTLSCMNLHDLEPQIIMIMLGLGRKKVVSL